MAVHKVEPEWFASAVIKLRRKHPFVVNEPRGIAQQRKKRLVRNSIAKRILEEEKQQAKLREEQQRAKEARKQAEEAIRETERESQSQTILQSEEHFKKLQEEQEQKERERNEKISEFEEKVKTIQEKIFKLQEEKHDHVAFLKQLLNEDQKRKQIEKEQAALLALEQAKQVQPQTSEDITKSIPSTQTSNNNTGNPANNNNTTNSNSSPLSTYRKPFLQAGVRSHAGPGQFLDVGNEENRKRSFDRAFSPSRNQEANASGSNPGITGNSGWNRSGSGANKRSRVYHHHHHHHPQHVGFPPPLPADMGHFPPGVE